MAKQKKGDLIIAYIYKITNVLNGKCYIGKTEQTTEERFKEHIRESKRNRSKTRPLYAAMKKYGVENFIVETLECTNCPNERERYWIEYYQSFKNGYNATIGGDGTVYLDYDLIKQTYNKVKTYKGTAKILGISYESVKKVIDNSDDISVMSYSKKIEKVNGRPVCQIDKKTYRILSIFPSVISSEKLYGINGHVGSVCQGTRKTAGGYMWRYINQLLLPLSVSSENN